jgi:hypothetical protein
MVDRGDFIIRRSALEEASERQSERPKRARQTDKARRAPVTTSVEAWVSDPEQLDFPGIDTPREEPPVLPKDLKDPRPTATTSPDKLVDPNPRQEERTSGTASAPFSEMAMARDRGVSVTPDEAFAGVAATSSRELGGAPKGKPERAPRMELESPPDASTSETEQSRRNREIAEVFERTETDNPLSSFAIRAKDRGREQDLDPGEAALNVASEIGNIEDDLGL